MPYPLCIYHSFNSCDVLIYYNWGNWDTNTTLLTHDEVGLRAWQSHFKGCALFLFSSQSSGAPLFTWAYEEATEQGMVVYTLIPVLGRLRQKDCHFKATWTT
jgi:hypothetical protein